MGPLSVVDSYEEKILEWMKLGVTVTVPGVHLMSMHRIEDVIRDGLVYALKARVLAEKLPDQNFKGQHVVTFTAPATTWQMFKRTHADSWWLRRLVARRPVRYTEARQNVEMSVNIQSYLTYPWQDKVTPGFGQAVRVPIIDTNWRP